MGEFRIHWSQALHSTYDQHVPWFAYTHIGSVYLLIQAISHVVTTDTCIHGLNTNIRLSFIEYNLLERGKDTQTPLSAVSLGSNENSDARACDENSESKKINDRFSEVSGFVFKSWCDGAKEQIYIHNLGKEKDRK